jgi:hypothetical protein
LIAALGMIVCAGGAAYAGLPTLPSTTVDLTFSEIDLAQGTALDSNYAADYDVTFVNLFEDLHYGGLFPNTSGAVATNFQTQCPCDSPIDIEFSGPVSTASLTLVTNTSSTPTVISTYLDGVEVQTMSVYSGPRDVGDVYTLSSSDFNEIVINPETAVNGSVLIDNLDYTFVDPPNINDLTGAPEPATWTMMMLGAAGIGASMRRAAKGRRTGALARSSGR